MTFKRFWCYVLIISMLLQPAAAIPCNAGIKDKLAQLIEKVVEIAGEIKDGASDAASAIGDKAGGLASTIGDTASGLASAIGDKVGGAASTIGDKVGGAASAIGDKAGDVASAIGDTAGGAASAIGDKVGGAASAISDKVGEVVEIVSEIKDEVTDFAEDVSKGMDPETKEKWIRAKLKIAQAVDAAFKAGFLKESTDRESVIVISDVVIGTIMFTYQYIKGNISLRDYVADVSDIMKSEGIPFGVIQLAALLPIPGSEAIAEKIITALEGTDTSLSADTAP